jgi:hypothetical protein
MRLIVGVACAVTLAAQQDAREIVRRSVLLDERNSKLALNYTFLERTETRQFSPGGDLKSTSSKTYDITMVEGSPYRRLVKRDDKPLEPREEAKEQEKLAKSIEERRRESPSQRAKRLQEVERHRAEDRKIVQEIPDAFDFRLLGEENIGGREAFLITATPKPGYKWRDQKAKMLTKFKGRIWIDKAEYQMVKADAETIDTITFGWFLARLSPGAKVQFEDTRINDEVWLPRHFLVDAGARLVFKKFHTEVEGTYSDYKKFQADSRVVSAEEVK